MQKYGELLRTLLEKRGIIDLTQADIFLNPDYERDMHDPFLMRDMERACARLFTAIENKEKIIIYADYDCDGIPGAVIMQDLLKLVDYKNYEVYIPQRNSEGYGLNMEAIEQFAKTNVKLLITIDLGITAIAEVAQAEVDGIDVIITDHHLAKQKDDFLGSSGRPHEIGGAQPDQLENHLFVLPRAYAILNPKTDDYPEKMLCGAGVVFKFAQGFLKKYGKENQQFKVRMGAEKWMLDMAGLATLSDMVPLLGENRVLAYYGMKVFRKSPRPGLQKLLAKMNIEQKNISEDDIGFMVTPRLNAASRMDNPMRAFELLATSDVVEAGVLANHLSKINDERKTIVTSIMRTVNKKLDAYEHKEVIVIGSPDWRVGILGLVAGKVSDQYKKPVFVWGKDENECIKGSCRSDGSVSVVELMTEAKESFIDFGGHELAGGFTVHNDKIHFLEDVLSQNFNKILNFKKGQSLKNIERTVLEKHDLVATLSLVNMKNWKEIEKMSPFGCGNEKPILFFRSVKIEKIKKFGKNGSGEHLEIIFSDSTGRAKAISFFSGLDSFAKTLVEGLNVDLLATFDLSRFRGKEELRLRIVDIL